MCTTFSIQVWIRCIFGNINDLDHKLVVGLSVNTSANNAVCTPVTDHDNKSLHTNNYTVSVNWTSSLGKVPQ